MGCLIDALPFLVFFIWKRGGGSRAGVGAVFRSVGAILMPWPFLVFFSGEAGGGSGGGGGGEGRGRVLVRNALLF